MEDSLWKIVYLYMCCMCMVCIMCVCVCMQCLCVQCDVCVYMQCVCVCAYSVCVCSVCVHTVCVCVCSSCSQCYNTTESNIDDGISTRIIVRLFAGRLRLFSADVRPCLVTLR